MTAVELYKQLEDKIRDISGAPISIENWTSVCSLMSRGMKAATIAKEADVSVLRFYRLGLEYLRRPPKEFSIERALENLDDSEEFYSAEEQLIIVNAFTDFADQLEEWAESQSLGNIIHKADKADKIPSHIQSLYCKRSRTQPYYKDVHEYITLLKDSFSPPLEPYATELNNNPYCDEFFVFQATRKKWRFCPRIIDALINASTEIPEDDPLIGKFIEWGAESVEKIPRDLLKLKGEIFSVELFRKNLEIKNEDYAGLFSRLNENVKKDQASYLEALDEAIEDSFCYGDYIGKDPLVIVYGRLQEIEKGIEEFELIDYGQWHLALAAALRLPRHELYYFDWAMTYPEDGPNEPGLIYILKDGTRQQVHYDVRTSKWLDDLACIEEKIEEIISLCKDMVMKADIQLLLNDWLEIEKKWKRCRHNSSQEYHCAGDLEGFALAFTDGLLKLSGVLPKLKQNNSLREEDKMDDEENEIISSYEAAVHRLESMNAELPWEELSAAACADMLIIVMVDFLKVMMEEAPFYYQRGPARDKELPSAKMLKEQVILHPLYLLSLKNETAKEIVKDRWGEISKISKRLFSLFEKTIGGYTAQNAKQDFDNLIGLLSSITPLNGSFDRGELIRFGVKSFRDKWYELGFELEKREQDIADQISLFEPGESPQARISRMNGRREWYAKNSPELPLQDSIVKMIMGTTSDMLFDLGLEAAPFRYSLGENSYTYETKVKVILTLDVNYKYRSDDDVDPFSRTEVIANRWAKMSRDVFMKELNQYCERRASNSPQNGNARRLWYEAMAIINKGPAYPVFSQTAAEQFVAKASEAAKEEWVETKMQKQKKEEMQRENEKYICEMMLEYLKDADWALMWDINRGLYNEGDTKIQIDESKKKQLMSAFPLQQEGLQKMLSQLEQRGIKRHEFLLPNNASMSRALFPFSEAFFRYRKDADTMPSSMDFISRFDKYMVDFICSWQCFFDDLPSYIDEEALRMRAENIFHEIYPMFERRMKLGDEGVDVDEYKRLFGNFKDKLLDIAAQIATKENDKKKKPQEVIVAGFTKDGYNEAVKIANTKLQERDFFSDKALRALFKVGENTPYNWRKNKAKPPQGFMDAYERKDLNAMRKCAEKYRASREHLDVMNTKNVRRNLSEEEIYKHGGHK